MSSPASTGSTSTSTGSNTANLSSMALSVLGVVGVIIGLGLQFAVINNGPSGDNIISGNMRNYGWAIITGFLLLFIGVLMWKIINPNSKGFIILFALTWISLLMSNFALMFSLYQVELNTT